MLPRFSDSERLEIAVAYLSGERPKFVARQYGTTTPHVINIAKRYLLAEEKRKFARERQKPVVRAKEPSVPAKVDSKQTGSGRSRPAGYLRLM